MKALLLVLVAAAMLTPAAPSGCATTSVGVRSETKYGDFSVNYTLPSRGAGFSK